MKFQSISLEVPTKTCVNSCKFCVSKIHDDKYVTKTDLEQIKHRLQFAKDKGCDTLILTGTGEALQNKKFLSDFNFINHSLSSPFVWIELQTSGVMLDQNNLDFLKQIGVKTISLSISDVFDSKSNQEMNGTPDKIFVDIDKTCKLIKLNDFNLRLSLNMTNVYNRISIDALLIKCIDLGADQLTMRKLFFNSEKNSINDWIKENKCSDSTLNYLNENIKESGIPIGVLPFGAIKYSILNDQISVVIDDDCMSKELKDTHKYLILRKDCKLYTSWDQKSSLVF